MSKIKEFKNITLLADMWRGTLPPSKKLENGRGLVYGILYGKCENGIFI